MAITSINTEKSAPVGPTIGNRTSNTKGSAQIQTAKMMLITSSSNEEVDFDVFMNYSLALVTIAVGYA
jgi:hypothetical protein